MENEVQEVQDAVNTQQDDRYETARIGLMAFLATHPRIKQVHISRALNDIKAPTLNQWMSGKYTGNVQRITAEVENFLQREKEKESLKRRDEDHVVETINLAAIHQIARDCHVKGKIGVVYGDSSLGKTVAVKEYAKKYADVILIESEYGYTPNVMVKRVAQALGLGDEGSPTRLKELVMRALADSGRLIIVDEAENLPTSSLEFLRRIHDKSGVGLFYTGMPRLIYNLRGNAGQFKQLYSRVRYAYEIGKLSQEDVRKILATTELDDEQIDKHFTQLYQIGKANIRRLLNTVEEFFRLKEIEDNAHASEKELMNESIRMTEV